MSGLQQSSTRAITRLSVTARCTTGGRAPRLIRPLATAVDPRQKVADDVAKIV